MRVHLLFAFAILIGVAAYAGPQSQAQAGPAHLALGGLASAADASPLLQPVYHHYSRRRGRCYPHHRYCRRHYGFGDIYIYRRKGRSCSYWRYRCRQNWFYPEDYRGCLRYYNCIY